MARPGSKRNNQRAAANTRATAQLTAREHLAVWLVGLFGKKVESPKYAADMMVRVLITAIALAGVGVTAYLTYTGFSGADVACTSSTTDGDSSCNNVLQSRWASVGSVPLALFGVIGYATVVLLAIVPPILRRFSPKTNWMFLSAIGLMFVAASMGVFSIYLLTGLWFRLDIEGNCAFCLTSAILSISLAISAGFVYSWRNVGPPFGVAAGALVLTLIVALPVFTVPTIVDGREVVAQPFGSPTAGEGWSIRTDSGESEMALAQHLLDSDAQMFGAWWCPHCHTQKELFGEEAYKLFEDGGGYLECSNDDRTTPTLECAPFSDVVRGFPTWVINGEVFSGAQNLDNLATASGYTGAQEFLFTQG